MHTNTKYQFIIIARKTDKKIYLHGFKISWGHYGLLQQVVFMNATVKHI